MKLSKTILFLTILALVVSMFAGCSKTDPKKTQPPSDTEKQAGTTEGTDNNDDYEEGTSDTDNIVKTVAAEKVILVVSFGTSFNQSRHLTIGGIETAVAKAFPDYQVRRAFTSQIIIDKLAKRENLKIDNVEEAMNRLVLDKVKEVVIQPTHVMSGFEYDDMIAEVMPFADKFESFKIGKPLLIDDVDYDEVVEQIVKVTSDKRAKETAIVLMGHGTEHKAGATYTKLQEVFNSKGYTDYVIGTVEHSIELDEVKKTLVELGAKNIVLRPLMVVAGDHANNDMASDEDDSWKTLLTGDGYKVETVLEGLGQIPGIQEIYIRHIKEAMAGESIKGGPTAAASGVTAARINNGTYAVEVKSDASMFKIVDCQLTAKDGSMTATVTMSGQGYTKLYLGKAEKALADSEDKHYNFTLADGDKHTFTIPVAALDTEIDCAALGKKSGKWYDHKLIFKSDGMGNDAFKTCQIDVKLTGGTGRASVETPATLMYKDGVDIARIVWSSPKYTYMLVDGDKKFEPVNTDGNSTFEIPVVLDVDMKVVACTVAMSEPKEIEYVLHFDSSTIK